MSSFLIAVCSAHLLAHAAEPEPAANLQTVFSASSARIDSCVVEPSRPNYLCQAWEEQLCAASCDIDEFGIPDCNNTQYWLCLSAIEEKCPDIPAVIEDTQCGDCIERPTHWITCTAPDGRSGTFACNTQIKEAYEERGYQCSACTLRNPPGEYRSCRCGDDLWREYCPAENSPTPLPAPPFCQQHPELCVSEDPPE